MVNPGEYYRNIAERVRSIPADHGLREHEARVCISTWSGGELGVGTEHHEETRLLVNGANPRVRFPSQREVALGMMSEGSVIIGPLTPECLTGGVRRAIFSAEDLQPGQTLHVKLTGPQCPDGVLYRLANVNLDRALRVTLTCAPAGNP